MPKVSIIIPLYNKSEYIEKCLTLLLDQQYQDFEIIVVDDGSTDNSSKIVEKITESGDRIRLIHQENQGVASARNRGLQEARGEWIWFVDADDRPDIHWLTAVGTHLDDSRRDIIFGEFVKVYPDGQEEKVATEYSGEISPEELAGCFMKEQYATGFFGYLWCKLIRKSFIEESGVQFQAGLTLAEDLKFMVQLYRNSPRCLLLHENAMYYTVDAVNSSGEKEIDYKAQLEIQYQIFQWIEQLGLLQEYQERRNFQISSYVAFVFYYGFENNNSISSEAVWLKEHPEYMSCLDTREMTGIMKCIVILIRMRCYWGVNLLLNIRTKVRKGYRRIRR